MSGDTIPMGQEPEPSRFELARDIILALAAVILAALRLRGMKSEFFQAVAHLYVGGMFVAWGTTRRWQYGFLAITISLVEVYAFLAHVGR